MKKLNKNTKRKIRVRKKLKKVSTNKFRISVFKSSKNLSAQIIDDKNNKTIVSASSVEKDLKNSKSKKIEVSNTLGEILAKRAKEKKIENVYFDRGENKYHGRIKAFAEPLRKNGIKF
jgi:large subunit ribosomal protein L18